MQKLLTSVGVNEGDEDGGDVGNGVGTEIVNVGDWVGEADGDALGNDVGSGVGTSTTNEGAWDGTADGNTDGTALGCGVGTEIMNVGNWHCKQNITWKKDYAFYKTAKWLILEINFIVWQ